MLRRGAHVDDRDGLTDMTLLHYACKAGAGNVTVPYKLKQQAVRSIKLNNWRGLFGSCPVIFGGKGTCRGL